MAITKGKKRFTKKKTNGNGLTKKEVTQVKSIAKGVHFKNSEMKWKGFSASAMVQPSAAGDFFLFHDVLALKKGTSSENRIGQRVRSMNVINNLHMSNSYHTSMYVRILLLKAVDPSEVPTSNNLLINSNTKAPIGLSGKQKDMTFRVNTEFWLPQLDIIRNVPGRGAFVGIQPAELQVGQSHWSRIFKQHKRLNSVTQYDLAVLVDSETPIKNNLYWTYIFGIPNGTSHIAQVDPLQIVNIDVDNYHFYRDI